MPKSSITITIIFSLLTATVRTAPAYVEHDFCVQNNAGETLEICLTPNDPLHYGTEFCFWVKDDHHCDQRNIYFENGCGYDLCVYGAVSRSDYGCIRNTSCEGVGYAVYYGSSPYVCGNSYCRDDVENDVHTTVYCFITASFFDKKDALSLELFRNIYYAIKDNLKSVCENKTQR